MLLSQNSGTLRDGSAQVLDAVNNMGAMLENFSSLSENFDVDAIAFLPATLYSISDTLDAEAGSLETIPGGLNAAIGAFSAALDQIQPVDEGGIAELRINNPGNATLEQLIANYRASMALKGVWETTMGNIQVSGDTATNAAALRAQAISLRAAAAAVENIIASGGVGDISELTNGLSQFAGAYSQLHNGIVQYTQGVDTLAANWGQLYGGMSQLSDGANRLSGGLGQLSAGTAGIPAKIKELMGDLELGEYEPISYLSEKNTNCALVQFVMMTDPIDAPAKEKPELELPPETGFWERFKALFAKADEASDEPAESDAQKSADK